MPAPLRLGLLSHLHGTGEPKQIYRDYVELFVAAVAERTIRQIRLDHSGHLEVCAHSCTRAAEAADRPPGWAVKHRGDLCWRAEVP